jgi:CRP-like cAMP-binding protein
MTYLNDQAKMKGSNDFTIPFNRQELADYLGVERSAMSAELGKLTKLGILRTQRSHFTLLKPLD